MIKHTDRSLSPVLAYYMLSIDSYIYHVHKNVSLYETSINQHTF